MTVTVDVEGVGQLVRVDLDADRVACLAPHDQNDFGQILARDTAGRLSAVPGFMVIMRDTGRPVVVVDAFGAAPALWGRITDDPPPVDLDVGRVEAMGDRLTSRERDDVERIRSGRGHTSPLRRMLSLVDKLAPRPAPLPRAVVEAAEKAALDVDLRIGPPVTILPPSTGGLGGVPSPTVDNPPKTD